MELPCMRHHRAEVIEVPNRLADLCRDCGEFVLPYAGSRGPTGLHCRRCSLRRRRALADVRVSPVMAGTGD
jgi:hypothetical protein